MSAPKVKTAPPVEPLSKQMYHQYTIPPNWSDPTVATQGKGTGGLLYVNTSALTEASGHLGAMVSQLQDALTTFKTTAAPLSDTMAGANWKQGQTLAAGIRKSYEGVQQFVTDLQDAHTQVAGTLTSNASSYQSTEADNKKLISQVSQGIKTAQQAPTAMTINFGGQEQQKDPYHGMTPQQRQLAEKLGYMNSMDEGEPYNNSWNDPNKQGQGQPYDITFNSTFPQGSASNVTPQVLQGMLASLPDQQTASNAATGYSTLYKTLTSIITGSAGVPGLPAVGTALAQNWGGQTAQTAVQNVAMLHQTASDLQAQTWQASQAMTHLSNTLAAYKGPDAQAAVQQMFADQQNNSGIANQSATNWANGLNQELGTTYNTLPVQLNQNLPPKKTTPGSGPGPAPGGGGGGGVGGVGGVGGLPAPTVSPGGGTTLASGVGAPPVPTAPPVTSPGAGAGAGVGGGTPVPPVPTVPVPGGTGSSPADPVDPVDPTDPVVPGEGSMPGADAVPGEGEIPVPKGFTTGVTGPAGEPVGDEVPVGAGTTGTSLASEGATAVGQEMPVSPFGMGGMGGMGGGAGAGGGQTRSRQAWESEDEGMWDPADDAVLPGGSGFSDGMIGSEVGDFAPAAASVGAQSSVYGSSPFGSAAGEGAAPYPGMGAGAAGRRDDSDRKRQAWMEEDADIWQGASPDVPPVIG